MPFLGQSEEGVRSSPIFATTHWSIVSKAGGADSPEVLAALEKLCRTYWFPLFSFIRRTGHGEEDAKDLTQEFFALLIERKDFQTVDARKGKFRTFLLASLTHFLSNQRDRAGALKRGGGKITISLDEMTADQLQRYEPASGLSPDKLFDQRWALTVLEQGVAQLEREMSAEGKGIQFEALKPFLTNEPRDGEYGEVASRLGLAAASIAVMVHRMRQRYRELVRAEVANTVSSPTEVEEELQHLRAVLES
jgi:RNA polymerase sigma-70 factor (ECF subfamily)